MWIHMNKIFYLRNIRIWMSSIKLNILRIHFLVLTRINVEKSTSKCSTPNKTSETRGSKSLFHLENIRASQQYIFGMWTLIVHIFRTRCMRTLEKIRMRSFTSDIVHENRNFVFAPIMRCRRIKPVLKGFSNEHHNIAQLTPYLHI